VPANAPSSPAFAYAGVAVDALIQPQDTVRDCHEGILGGVRLAILAHKKGGRLPARKMDCQAFQESPHVAPPSSSTAARGSNDGADRIHNYQARADPLHLTLNGLQHAVQALVENRVAQADIVNAAADFVFVEEGELLLIAQQLEWRLADDGEVQRWPIRRCQTKHDLLGQCCFARARCARDEVEAEFGMPPPSTSSNPGTPVGSWLITALSRAFKVRSTRLVGQRPTDGITRRTPVFPLAVGSHNPTVMPCPSPTLSAHIRPPCADAICRQMCRPSPMPDSPNPVAFAARPNGSKMRSSAPGVTPIPVSLTVNRTPSTADRRVTSICPRSGEYLTALLKRLSSRATAFNCVVAGSWPRWGWSPPTWRPARAAGRTRTCASLRPSRAPGATLPGATLPGAANWAAEPKEAMDARGRRFPPS
jgi:hypothetical protein